MRASALLLLPLPLVAALAQGVDVQGITTLDALCARARPLLIFAPQPDDPQLEIQVRTLKQHAAEAANRDLVPIAIPFANPSPTDAYFSPQEAERLRRRFNIAPADFTVILIGKDGDEKLRSRKPLSITRLDRAIEHDTHSR